ncbi:response regulator [Cnuibacter sp. UC19_7]|uniref:response regulator n=1 Tax=Cnuibacter sp. UC19_7 TaxID=3350166 RepID=UPI003671BE27
MIRIFLVDDHELVRRGVADMLEVENDLTIVGEAGSIAQALARLEAVEADVAILDVRLPDGSGIDLCRQIRSTHPDLRCLMLTAYDDDEATMSAVLAGAAGYVLKDVRGPDLARDVREVAAGRRLLHAAAVKKLESTLTQAEPTDPRFGSLGLRERQILALIGQGMTNRQIGDQLALAEKTVKNYVSSLLEKLGLERRTQAAVFEAQHRFETRG